MKICKDFILLLILLLIPVSAQAFGIKKTMRVIMDSWVGASINTVIRHWGYPTNEKLYQGEHCIIGIGNTQLGTLHIQMHRQILMGIQ